MKRFIPSIAFALGCTALVASAQETTRKTEVRRSGGDAQVVGYTGCVQTGTQARTYVEVTGVLIEGGTTRTETRTRTDRDDAPDSKTRSVETRSTLPEFKVTSIRDIGSC
jgi:hypothetical protein